MEQRAVDSDVSSDPLPRSSGAEPTTREDFLQYYTRIRLDPNTAHEQLALSEGNTRATVTEYDAAEAPPDHVDRFVSYGQVLSSESLPSRAYWELEWDADWVYVAVSYSDIDRTGSESGFGFNDKSWALDCDHHHGHYFWSHREEASISGPVASRVGVFVDQNSGVLAFYDVTENMRLIHREHCTFTQPLFAGVCFNYYKARDTAWFPALTDTHHKHL